MKMLIRNDESYETFSLDIIRFFGITFLPQAKRYMISSIENIVYEQEF